MAETVGQHSVAAFTSPLNGTTPIDANSVRGNDNTVRSAYVDHDADPGIHVQSSTLASRPVAGTAGRKWITVSSGRYQLWYDDGSRWHEVASDAINVDCLADANLAKGDVVKVTGFNNGQNLPTVNKVTSSTDVAFGLVENTVTSGNIVQIVNTGLIEDLNTGAFAINDILYPNTSGGLTLTKPTSGNYQPVAFVLRSNNTNGVLYVEFSAPRIVERSDNTASTIVLRDASGNFAAGTITAGALTSTGLVTFASLKGTGATTVTNILDEDNMASDSATALATQQSIKAYVDTKVATVDTLAEVLANGNTTGATDIIVTAGQKITTDTIAETTAAAGVTIDSVLLKDNAVTATTFNGTLNGAAPAGSLSGTTLASNVVSSSLTSVGTLANLTVTNPITGSVTGSSGSTTGNAATATALQTARNINGVSFNGTADITVTAAAGTLTGTTLASGVTASSLTSVGTLSSLTVSGAFTGSTIAANSNSNGVVTNGSFRNADAGTDARTRVRLGNDAEENALTIDILSSTNTVGNNMARIINQTGTGVLVLGTNGTEKMRLDASGNLGLGVTPSYKLHVVNDTAATNSAVDVLALTQSTTGTAASGLGAGILFNSERPSGGIILKRGAIYGVAGTNADDNGDLAFYTLTNTGASGFSEKMRLDASGNLGVGTTSPATRLDVAQTNAKSATAVWQIQTFDTTSATTGVGGGISFGGYKTSNTAAEVFAAIDGYKENATGGNAAGALRFHTQVSGGTGVVERARITSGGDVQIRTADAYLYSNGTSGGTTIDAGFRFLSSSKVLSFWTNDTEKARITSGGYFKASNDGTYANVAGLYHEFRNTTTTDWTVRATHSAASPYGIYVSYTGAAPNGTGNEFLYCEDSSAQRAAIRSNGGLANYSANNVNLASDFRLKKDIAPLASTWDKLKAIEVVNFRYKDCNEDDPALYGVIAQQVQPIVPELVVVTREAVEAKDAVLDEDGNEVKPAVEAAPEYYGIREQPMYWLAIKALQEAQARIEALEVEVAALKANA